MSETSGIHVDHRSRLRDRLISCGVQSLEPHELLEFLLYTPIRRRNTNVIAHRLMARFGSLHKVLSASMEELTAVEGVGEHTAQFLIDFGCAVEHYTMAVENPMLHIMSTGDVYACADEFFAANAFARCALISLNGFCGLINISELPPEPTAHDLLSTSLKFGALRAVLVFKDVKNLPPKSAEALAQTLAIANVRLLDCVTVGETYSSLFEEIHSGSRRYMNGQELDGAVLLHSQLADAGFSYVADASHEGLSLQTAGDATPNFVRESQRLVHDAKNREDDAAAAMYAARTRKGVPLDPALDAYIGEHVDPDKLSDEMFEIMRKAVEQK